LHMFFPGLYERWEEAVMQCVRCGGEAFSEDAQDSEPTWAVTCVSLW